MSTISKFYVYEHWRPDKDVCFWVGKGHGNRAYDFRRNFHYNNVVKKLARLGMCVEVRLVDSGLIEVDAFALERVRISFWRGTGVVLTNYTDGGEGVSGLKHSEATRLIIREKRKKQKIPARSAETKQKISKAHTGRKRGPNPAHSERLKGRKLSAEHRRNIGLGSIGKIQSSETRAKIGRGNRGLSRSVETIEKLRVSHLGKSAPAAVRAKMAEPQKVRWTDPELRESVRAKMQAQWRNPEYRARVLESRRVAAAKKEMADGANN